MKKTDITVEVYEIDIEDNKYLVFKNINMEDNQYIDFNIQKKGYGVISYCGGIPANEITPTTEEYIEGEIEEWIKVCEYDIKKLEA